jgi:hypothetical protein
MLLDTLRESRTVAGHDPGRGNRHSVIVGAWPRLAIVAERSPPAGTTGL